ncbi:MAG: TIGR03960 family B12-binding radical SAM protein [Defluviitaleaceae bacterium]|nr:TIGR03960 family B12-binding radical SAM protein [Defluviitaleaceae bacterium]MCL2263746.1 TIGR03960 family B12-binding radical SAM protein [Defluviitaleaceae bacterium]
MITPEKLLRLEKPGRYTGGEINAVSKETTPEITRFAFCFPDVYEIGMSHLGLQILYFFMNRREDTFCERVFMPWLDAVEFLREENEPLFALETGAPLNEFDFLGFTLQYEMSYTNVLAMLDLAGIPLRAAQRGDAFPLVCAGGSCATNPEPMADFIDFFYIGDGEVSLDEILNRYSAHKKSGGGKKEFLQKITDIDGVYVPAFYDAEYNADGTLKSFAPKAETNAPATVKRAFLPRLEFFPATLIVPLVEATHARAVVEIARGCKRGCRFCQAGFIYRPVRERETQVLLSQAEKILASTGYEEISLLSLSACDYKNFGALVDGLLEICTEKRVNISLPSTRLDALSALEKIRTVRRSSLTVAPEAGSQRLRDSINKNLTEDEILDGCFRAFKAGFDKIKLYFMGGLPSETTEDALAAAELCEKIVSKYYELTYEERKRPVSIGVSTACFVPKPFTPFQWAAQDTPEEFTRKQKEAKAAIRKKQISYRYHDAKTSQLEGVLARGCRRLSAAIESAYKNGAIFDGWTEHFRYDTWLSAFAEHGISPAFYANRQRETAELLPWDFIDIGVTKSFFLREWEKSKQAQTTPDCRENCAGCGVGCTL